MFKWFKKKVMPTPAPQLSELGAEIMEAVQNPDEWHANEHTVRHKSGLELWIANRDEKHTYFRIYRLPTVVVDTRGLYAGVGEAKLHCMLSAHDIKVLAPMTYELHGMLYGTLESITLNALRLARQTGEQP